MINIIKKDDEYIFLEEIKINIGGKEQKIILELDKCSKVTIAYDKEEKLVIGIFPEKDKAKEIEKIKYSYKKLGFEIEKIAYHDSSSISNKELEKN